VGRWAGAGRWGWSKPVGTRVAGAAQAGGLRRRPALFIAGLARLPGRLAGNP
jgi:hypothetical protein